MINTKNIRLAGPRTHICWTPDAKPPEERDLISLVKESDLAALIAENEVMKEEVKNAKDWADVAINLFGWLLEKVDDIDDIELQEGGGDAVLANYKMVIEKIIKQG